MERPAFAGRFSFVDIGGETSDLARISAESSSSDEIPARPTPPAIIAKAMIALRRLSPSSAPAALLASDAKLRLSPSLLSPTDAFFRSN
ncbi:MAG: hypothetical protein JF594_09435 [Rhizobium leguminosarum]|nr:hypothetical protein [Rhizobium leguminosarum]